MSDLIRQAYDVMRLQMGRKDAELGMKQRHKDEAALRSAKAFKPKAGLLQEQFPTRYMPGVGRQVMADGGAPAPQTDALGLYSRGAQAAQMLSQAKGSPGQMRATLENRYNVKPAEFDHAGFDQAFANRKTVTRDELAEHFEANAPALKETVLGLPAEIGAPQDIGGGSFQVEAPNGAFRIMPFHDDDETESYSVFGPDRTPPSHDHDSLEAALDHIRRSQSPTEYEEHTLPGGDNYREVLLQLDRLPQIEQAVRARYADKIRDLDARIEQTARDAKAAQADEGEPMASIIAEQNAFFTRDRAELEDKIAREAKDEHAASAYTSGHWRKRPDVLAHIRMSDRIQKPGPKALFDISRRIAEGVGIDKPESMGSGAPQLAVQKGAITPEEAASYSRVRGFRNEFSSQRGIEKKLLHVEEIQSDWGQEGRKKGFKGDNFRFSVADKPDDEGFWAVLNPEGKPVGHYSSQEKAAEVAKIKEAGEGGHRIPSAPFVTSTEQWTDLALKRILKEAADGDYDGVVFTPGDAQVERWDDEGLARFYDTIVPKRAQKLLRDLGHAYKPVEHTLGNYTLPGFAVTPELKERIRQGMPHFRDGGAVDGGDDHEDLFSKILSEDYSSFQ